MVLPSTPTIPPPLGGNETQLGRSNPPRNEWSLIRRRDVQLSILNGHGFLSSSPSNIHSPYFHLYLFTILRLTPSSSNSRCDKQQERAVSRFDRAFEAVRVTRVFRYVDPIGQF